MRKGWAIAGGLVALLAVTAGILGLVFGLASVKSDKTLIFGNFAEYESPSLQEKITSEIEDENPGVNVQYTYYNLNNQLPALYENKQITIGVPTDYEAAQLISLGLIKPLNYSLFNTNGMHLGYYLNGKYVPIENGILPLQVNLQQQDPQYNVPYTLDGSGQTYSQSEAYQTEYKYSICNLLSPGIICDISQIYLHCDFNGMTHINIFNYDLPYFFQNYTFAYTTNGVTSNSELAMLNSLNTPQTWNQILPVLKNVKWFNSVKARPKIGIVGSPQSVYSLAACLQDNSNGVPITNPDPNNSTIKEMENTYGAFTSYLSKKNLGSNPVYNSASSAGIINELDNGQLHGGFCYNGDALYTAMGGNYATTLTSSQWQALTPSTFHVVHPKYTMIALDTVGISKYLSNNLILPTYEFMYDLCLDGADASPTFSGYNEPTSKDASGNQINYANTYTYLLSSYQDNPQLINLITGSNETHSCPFYYWSQATNANNNNNPWMPNSDNATNFIGSMNSDGQYQYGTMQNFSYNLYVSPWLSINNFVGEIMTSKGAQAMNASPGMNWFTTQTAYPFSNNQTNFNAFNSWFENIYTINPSNYVYAIPKNINFVITRNTCVELPLNKYQISNQAIAFNDSMYQDFGN